MMMKLTHTLTSKKTRPMNLPWIPAFVVVFTFFMTFGTAFGLTPDELKDKGNVYFQKREYAKAVEEFTRAIEINHEYVEAFYNRGLAYYELRLYYKAIVDFDMVLMLAPQVREAYYHRGLAYSRVNKLKLALADVKKAAEMGDEKALAALKSGELTDRMEKERSRQANIQSLINDKQNVYGRTVTVTSIGNEFGGNTVMTAHSKGDPLFDGRDGVFRSVDYFNASDVLIKTEVFHTYLFNTANGRYKTVYWYNSDMTLSKTEYFLSGRKLTLKEVRFYDKQGQPVRTVLMNRFGHEIKP